jgi:hypothetical protein
LEPVFGWGIRFMRFSGVLPEKFGSETDEKNGGVAVNPSYARLVSEREAL